MTLTIILIAVMVGLAVFMFGMRGSASSSNRASVSPAPRDETRAVA